MGHGEPYANYTRIFSFESSPVTFSSVSRTAGFFNLLLLILTFLSLSLALIGDRKKKNPLAYIAYAAVASLSIGYGSISISNYVGVYI
ncbi:uncharacterized protein RJT20DRAFT_127095 [Scheffersomyces xylosifermentans]|uniref:uncharacterized protein n=1 Tax=Scheffersomyces xylosifermentans TaxID=1304137 RepID=UPI00315CB745